MKALLKWALILFILSLVAGMVGWTGLAGGLATGAKILFGIFLAIAALLALLAVTVFKAIT